MTMIYVISGSMIVFGILGIIGLLVRVSNQGKKELLEEMFKNGDIDSKVYKKYL